jgi:hypothetical protein
MADYGKLNPLMIANALRGIAPHGFRHVESLDEVSLPKGSGFYGYLPNQTGQVSTELSASNDNGSYPMINPAMNQADIQALLNNQPITDQMYNKAEQWSNYRKAQGQSPFMSPVGEMRWPMPKD